MMENRSLYEKRVQDRSLLKYYIGLVVRWKMHLKHTKAVKIARKRGAIIGDGVIMPLSLAKKANSNLKIGNHVSINTDKIDLRSPVTIGNYVIIGNGNEILTTSHNIDSPDWEPKHYGIEIEDYVWITSNAIIMPSCRNIGRGAVIGGGSLVVRNVEELSVVSGNPAKEIRKRRCVHSSHVVEANLGGDYKIYKMTYSNKYTRKKDG